MSARRIAVLTKMLLKDSLHDRILIILFVFWTFLLIAGNAINLAGHTNQRALSAAERANAAAFYDNINNANLGFAYFYTVKWPTSRYSPLVQGVDYLAPRYMDYRPRFSPTFYHGDDTDPLMQLFPPLDLTTMVGLIGFFVVILVGYRTINGANESKNLHLLLLAGATLNEFFAAAILSIFIIVGTPFFAVYMASIGVLLSTSPLTLSVGVLAFMGAIALVYLLFCSCVAVAISGVCRRAGSAFLVNMGVALLLLYVTPPLAERIVHWQRPMPYGHADLLESKVLFSRQLHTEIDPELHKTIYPEFPESIDPDTVDANKAPVGELREAWSDVLDTWDEAISWFAIKNSEGALERDRDYFDLLEAQNYLTRRVATSVSPYIALSDALAIFGDTSISDEFALISYAGDEYFRQYREWWLKHQNAGIDMDSAPIGKWVFADSLGGSYDYPQPEQLERPSRPLAEKIAAAFPSLASLGLWTIAALMLGAFGLRRLGYE